MPRHIHVYIDIHKDEGLTEQYSKKSSSLLITNKTLQKCCPSFDRPPPAESAEMKKLDGAVMIKVMGAVYPVGVVVSWKRSGEEMLRFVHPCVVTT